MVSIGIKNMFIITLMVLTVTLIVGCDSDVVEEDLTNLEDVIIDDSKVFYKKEEVGSYTIYEANQTVFAKGFDNIYEKDEITYCFSNIRSHSFLLVNGFEQVTLQDALENKKVSPEELMHAIEEIGTNCP